MRGYLTEMRLVKINRCVKLIIAALVLFSEDELRWRAAPLNLQLETIEAGFILCVKGEDVRESCVDTLNR